MFNLQDLTHAHKPETVTDSLMLEKNILTTLCKEWEQLDPMGFGYSPQVQKDVSNSVEESQLWLGGGVGFIFFPLLPWKGLTNRGSQIAGPACRTWREKVRQICQDAGPNVRDTFADLLPFFYLSMLKIIWIGNCKLEYSITWETLIHKHSRSLVGPTRQDPENRCLLLPE